MDKCPLTQQSEALVTLLPQIARRLFSLANNDLAFELPAAQLRVCNVLREGPRTITSLRQEFGISLSAINQIVDRLEAAGLVERSADAADRRCKSVYLTDRAITVLQERRELRLARANLALAHLPVETRTEIIRALETLLDAANTLAPVQPDATYADQLA